MDRLIKASKWTIAVAGGITVGLGLMSFTKHLREINKSDLDYELDALTAVRSELADQYLTEPVSVNMALTEYVEALLAILNTNTWYRLVHKSEYDTKFRTRLKELNSQYRT